MINGIQGLNVNIEIVYDVELSWTEHADSEHYHDKVVLSRDLSLPGPCSKWVARTFYVSPVTRALNEG